MMSECDIFTAPLLNTNFSKCKSNIKLLEIGAGSKPAVFSDIRQYKEIIHNGDNGYLAGIEYDWYRYLKELILDEQKRIDIGKSLYEKVYNQWQMKDGVNRYAEYFKDVYNGKKTSFLIDKK
jgi:glycosyltransferase involved in cell wall biosynthesis